jgi:7-cyano-7-deazaguanine reductase
MDRSSIDYAEGRVFSFNDESGIRPDFLQTIDYSGPRQRISYQMIEFAAVCPFSGLPDTGIVWVDYIPQNKLVELKSLKYYFISFRNVGIYQEDVTSRIFNDLNPLLESEELLIKTRYSTRGGIDTTCTINSNEQKS